MAWRYFATRLNGDGTEDLIAPELPLTVDSFTETLSGPNTMSASIDFEVAYLKDEEGRPVLRRWQTAIYAEKDDVIRWGGILKDIEEDGQRLALTVEGFFSYAYGQPYIGEKTYIQADPLVIARHIWEHLQAQDGGNIALVLDETTSPVRVGTETEDVEFETGEGNQVSFEAGPYRLAFYKTHDLGGEFDNLAEATPFDYAEIHEWQGDIIRHRLRLGYPKLGSKRSDLRFVVGENVFEEPVVEQNGDDYATEVIVLGAGEGREMIRGSAEVNERDGLRRVKVITDKSAASKPRANAIAKAELQARVGAEDISSLVVVDHPNAPLGSFHVGDEILVQGSGLGWGGDLYLWVRILEISTSPGAESASLTVTRSERTETV